jgi:anti-sigma B factor antagonist
MTLKIREQNNVVILDVKGKMMGGPDATVFQDAIKTELAKGHKNFVINLAEVDWMNSSGLGSLIGGLTTLRNAGGDMKLSAITDKIHSLLMITKLVTIFESYETVDDAVKHF